MSFQNQVFLGGRAHACLPRNQDVLGGRVDTGLGSHHRTQTRISHTTHTENKQFSVRPEGPTPKSNTKPHAHSHRSPGSLAALPASTQAGRGTAPKDTAPRRHREHLSPVRLHSCHHHPVFSPTEGRQRPRTAPHRQGSAVSASPSSPIPPRPTPARGCLSLPEPNVKDRVRDSVSVPPGADYPPQTHTALLQNS